MRFRSGMLLMLAAGLVSGGCAAGTASGGGVASAAEANYPPGIRPRETDETRRAQVLLLQENYGEAISVAQAGLAADSTNARYHLIIAEAEIGQGDFEAANEAFEAAERIYPAYELEVVPLREQAWAVAFNEGVEAYNADDSAGAIEAWERANLIYALRPEGFQNLAALYTQAGDYDAAIAAYQAGLDGLAESPVLELTAEEQAERDEALFQMQENLAEILLFTERYAEAEALYREQLARDTANIAVRSNLASAIASQPGREAEGQAMYNELLSSPDLRVEDYQDIGVALFSARNYARAAEAFSEVAEARPNSRDAWYNYANALYAGEAWPALLPIAEKLVTLDPLNEDSWLILARAQREAAQNQAALTSLETIEAMPIKLADLVVRTAAGSTSVRGSVVGGTAAAGTPLQLRFNFYGVDGASLGTETVSVTAPATDATTPLTATLESDAVVGGYSYQLVN